MALLRDDPLEEVAQLAGDGLLAALAQAVPGAAAAAERCAQELRDGAWDGDQELAEQLEAALGAGPAPARWVVPADLDELGSHLEGSGGELEPRMRLQVATGEFWPDRYNFEATTGKPLPDDSDDPDAWLVVDPQGSRDGYRDMQVFTATIADRRLADRLDNALEGRGAFRRFRDMLADREDEAERWQVFSDERVRGRARSWLALHGYQPA